jgi:hypothetical protein
MHYILIIMWVIGGKPAITAVPMSSQTACNAAIQMLKKEHPTGFNEWLEMTCVPDWSKQP